jgi:poly [ADP-ribose] polymerase
VELKKMLANYGASNTGARADLIDRLEAYDRGEDVPAKGGRGKTVSNKSRSTDDVDDTGDIDDMNDTGANDRDDYKIPVKTSRVFPIKTSPTKVIPIGLTTVKRSPVKVITTKAAPIKSSPVKAITTKAAPVKSIDTLAIPKSSAKKIIPVDKGNNLSNASVVENYSAQLNQTDIAKNANKFYNLQVLTDGPSYYLLTRYGRTGEPMGRVSVERLPDKNSAINAFTSLYYTKTGNSWGSSTFISKKNKYTLIDTEYEIETVTADEKSPIKASGLSAPVLNLLSMITNQTLMTQTMQMMNIDLKKMPLGRISDSQIDIAERVLKQIEQAIKNQDSNDTLMDLSSQFWTLIPYASGRNQRPPILETMNQVEKQSDFLQDMRQMTVAAKFITQRTNLDDIYIVLRTDIVCLDRLNPEFLQMESYIMTTHSQSHNFKLRVINMFKLQKDDSDDSDSTNVFGRTNDHRLLLHGSKMTNFAGILKTGFRIPTPGTVSNGSMLGMGVYFADAVSKSYQYTQGGGSNYNNSRALIAICEVALGNKQIRTSSDSSTLPLGFDSRMGLGQNHPDPRSHQNWIMDSRVVVPIGKIIPNQLPAAKNSILMYNEYVIFRPELYRFRYLVELESYNR